MRNHNREENSFAFCSVSYLIWSWDKEIKKWGGDGILLNQGHAEKEPLFDSIVICLFFLLLLLKCSVLISEKGERCDLTVY